MILGDLFFISSIEIFCFFFLGMIPIILKFLRHYSHLLVQIYTFCITILKKIYTKIKKNVYLHMFNLIKTK